ncbi:MAG: DUF6526 family protein [Acidobacteriota bacterium]
MSTGIFVPVYNDSTMEEQSFAKHAKSDPLFHFTLIPITLLIFIGSLVNLYQSLDDHSRLYNASLIAAMAFAMLLNGFLTRIYPLKAQDRAIRAEENLRHYVLTGKLLDRSLTVKQIVALRFSSDAEFPALAAKASGMDPKAMKEAIKSWRPDHDRL